MFHDRFLQRSPVILYFLLTMLKYAPVNKIMISLTLWPHLLNIEFFDWVQTILFGTLDEISLQLFISIDDLWIYWPFTKNC